MADDNGRDLAKYLNEHPGQAESLRASLKRFTDHYKVAESAMDSMKKQLEDVQLRIRESLKPLRLTEFNVDTFRTLSEQFDAIFPKNWPRPIPATERIEAVLSGDGIPIVHIPRAEIVQAIVDAEDYDARIQIIEARADDIAVDCRIALDRDYHNELSKQLPLVRKAVVAYQDGHHEAAQALAVSICDTYFKKLYRGDTYRDMQKKVGIDQTDEMSIHYLFNLHYALAAAALFLTPWFPDKNEEPPTKLSRHVTIHHAGTDHMTKLNATVSIMLVTALTAGIDWGLKRAEGNRSRKERDQE